MIGIIIGIFGIVITISFGIYTIYKGRKSKKKIGLTFQKKECYSLFEKDVKRLNIDINYQQKPITNSLILLKAILRNNGQLDIDESSIYKPLIIISDKEYSWLEFNIISKPKGVNITFEKLNDTQLQIKWDLLKVEESIEFEVLINVVASEKIDESAIKFYNSLKFDYRITNLNKIEIEKDLPKTIQDLNEKKMIAIVSFYILLFTLFVVILPELNVKIRNRMERYLINFEVCTRQDTLNTLLSADSSQLIKIGNSETKLKEKLSVSKFNEKYKIQKIISLDIANSREEPSRRIFGCIVALIMIFSIIVIRITKKKLKIKLQDY